MYKFMAALGATAFLMIVSVFGHQYYENAKYASRPDAATQLKSVVGITIDGTGYCSGWVKAGTHEVVTAAHCAPADITDSVAVDFGDGNYHPFHVQFIGQAIGDERLPDLMTLTTNDPSVPWPAGLETCSFKPYYHEPVAMLGGPLGIAQTSATGTVSNPSSLVSKIDPNDSTAYIQFDGQMYEGNSGGPLVDREYGCVVGSADFLRSAMPQAGVPIGVNFVTPITDLNKINAG